MHDQAPNQARASLEGRAVAVIAELPAAPEGALGPDSGRWGYVRAAGLCGHPLQLALTSQRERDDLLSSFRSGHEVGLMWLQGPVLGVLIQHAPRQAEIEQERSSQGHSRPGGHSPYHVGQ